MEYVAITGTSTSVGKTWTTCALVSQLRTHDRRLAARKPCQSFDPTVDLPDSVTLSRATGERSDVICPQKWTFELPLAPPLAATALCREEPQIRTLLADMERPASDCDICLIEGVGGVRSPLATDGDIIDFMRVGHITHAVLVADAGLGTLNSIRLCLDALQPTSPMIYLNRFDHDDLVHRRNHDWLTNHGLLASTTVIDLTERIEKALCL